MEHRNKPDIFRYHDYRTFLKDWFAFHKSQPQPKRKTLKSISKDAGFTTSYLSMVLKGERKLSESNSGSLVSALKFPYAESTYFNLMRVLGDSEDQVERVEAAEKMQKFLERRGYDIDEIQSYRYLKNWYTVVIREMAQLKDFKPDAEWIRKRLKNKVSLNSIKETLDLLQEKNLIIEENGSFRVSEAPLSWKEGAYRLALTQFHEQVLDMAKDSIHNTPREQRTISGCTVALTEKDYQKIKEIIDQAREKITNTKVSSEKGRRAIYQVTLGAFPVTEWE